MVNYPAPIKQRKIRAVQPSEQNKTNKYGAKKTVLDGHVFDSKAEAKYYYMLKMRGITNFKMQEEFLLQDAFEINGKRKQAIKYKPDFTFYEDGQLVKVVDVKGKRTADFNIKAKMFMKRYGIPLILAKYDYKSKTFDEEMAWGEEMTKEEIIKKWRKELESTNRSLIIFMKQYKANESESLLRIIGQLRQESLLFENFINDLEEIA